MKIITCASYFATGSSAVTDYFSEFDNIESLGRNEYRFIQDPDGISDLEYNIVENNHRHNTSHAIKRYLKLIKSFKGFAYGGKYDLYGKDFDKLTEEYIDSITELKTSTWWHRDRADKGELFCYIDRFYSLVRRLFTGTLKNERKFSLLKNRERAYYTSISEEEFLNYTRKYIEKVIKNKASGKEFVMVDQLVPPTNLERYLRYFDDIKVVVVDRDPRDVFLYVKTRIGSEVIPTNKVEDFVKWFKITRKYSKPSNEDKNRVLRIQFEDIIYKYDETTKLISNFIGVSDKNHVSVKKYLDPDVSIKNTNLKNKLVGFEKEIKYIEDNLREYLYDFK